MFYLICYDIVDDRRRNRTANLLEGHGLRIQRSVFECTLTPDQYEFLQRRLKTRRYLHPEEDQIRFYPMSPRYRKLVVVLGTQPDYQVDDAVFIA